MLEGWKFFSPLNFFFLPLPLAVIKADYLIPSHPIPIILLCHTIPVFVLHH